MTPKTIARSSASAPQISFAQDIESGPYGTEIRAIKYANHLRPEGTSHIARIRAYRKPKNYILISACSRISSRRPTVEMDITRGLFRRKSLSTAKVTVDTNWTALCPVGIMF
jgi:hypothetical protein